MEDLCLPGTFYTPVGRQLPEFALSRRAFMGGTLAAPGAALLFGANDAGAHTHDSEEKMRSTLRFSEDKTGVTVTYYPAPPKPSKESQDSLKKDPEPQQPARSWFLARRSFGPDTSFLLRTLSAGSERGYELRVHGARFGTLEVANHWFVFLRSAKETWSVRMRTKLWTPADGLAELTSSEVPFENLWAPRKPDDTAVPNDPDHSHSFRFLTNARQLAPVLEKVFEDHVRVAGQLELALRSDGVWQLGAPLGSGHPSSAVPMTLAGGAFSLRSIEFAWCDAMPNLLREKVRNPVFCASGEIVVEDTLVFAPGRFPRVMLAASPIPSPSMAAKKKDAALVEEAAPSPTPPRWTYTRDDWLTASARHPSGISKVKAAWEARIAVQSRRPDFGPIRVSVGVLQRVRGESLRFAGHVDVVEQKVQSRIGRLVMRGWSVDDGDIAMSTASSRSRHPLLTIESASIAAALTSIEVPMLLLRADVAPGGCDFSALEFAPTSLLALYHGKGSDAHTSVRQAQSYLWLGKIDQLNGLPLAHVDLTRARLEVSRVKDLARLAFMFTGLHLNIERGKAWLADERETCRVMQRQLPKGDVAQAEVLDPRSTLVVEFGPQHVLEESVFRPGGPALPDVELKAPSLEIDWSTLSTAAQGLPKEKLSTSTSVLMRSLEKFRDPADRMKIRQELRQRKIDQEEALKKESGENDRPFASFSRRFDKFFRDIQQKLGGDILPAEQVIYIGPLGMDADVGAMARQVNTELQKDIIFERLTRMLSDADRLIDRLKSNPTEIPPTQGQTSTFDSFAKWFNAVLAIFRRDAGSAAAGTLTVGARARLRERAVSSTMQEYGFFRDFYLERMISEVFVPSAAAPGMPNVPLPTTGPMADDLEFFSARNRDGLATSGDLVARTTFVLNAYVDVVRGTVAPRSVMRARLAGSTRLAFRVDCGSRPGRGSDDLRPTSGGTRLPFSFDALTDWARFDLAVTPRAQQMLSFDDGGMLIRTDDDTKQKDDTGAVDEDLAMLRSVGVRSGRFITAQERLAQIESSLRVSPTPMQTAIELPARLILSPSQKAQWRTRRATWARDTSVATPLWTANLALDGPDPRVRAVFSPDLRPGFVRGGLERALARARIPALSEATVKAASSTPARPIALHVPIVSAPPRGPRAPWTLGIEDGDSESSSLEDIYAATRPHDAPPTEEFCRLIQEQSRGQLHGPTDTDKDPPKPHPLVAYLCARRQDKSEYGENAIFRASLDAYDRHELVLLSSAWGLPVRGRLTTNGTLQAVQTSSQVELPPEWQPNDLEAGTALYRPRALKLQELALSALGGTLRHDSNFVPPASARHIAYGPLFESLSIERWQHWTVLGRDVFAEVVYKGYLFPIGHRASLVKQTERVFLRHEAGGTVRAYLRQRMFIRIAEPDKAFPAPGQPNGGRQFPASAVRMLTSTTPDIVDPAEDTANFGDEPSPAGRLFANEMGLVFWPRTARVSGSDVHFELQVQSAITSAALIFVDNVAVNRADQMERLVNLYNKKPSPDAVVSDEAGSLSPIIPSEHVRTLDFAGQVLRYCDELKPASTSHKTISWTLKATGGAGASQSLFGQPANAVNPWEGHVSLFDDPALEGADQPPFYPALETARMRVDQVERLTAGAPQLVLAQFDGWYVQNGFGASKGAESLQDSLEVYLDIINTVTLSMGSSGDRSGGVMRPGGLLIALSRQRGPLSGAKPKIGPTEMDSVVKKDGKQYPVTSVGAAAFRAPAPKRGDPSTDPSYVQYLAPQPDVPEMRILGLVSVNDLLKWLDVGQAARSLPLLQEVVEYTVAGEQVGVEALRQQVIAPLYGVVKDLARLWQQAGKNIPADASGFFSGMDDVFPDVDRSLKDLLAVLQGATDSSDDAALIASLAEVYESGRRLVDACTRVIANPLDSVQIAFQRKLGALSQAVSDFETSIAKGLVAQALPDPYALVMSAEQIPRLFGYPFSWIERLGAELQELNGWFKATSVKKALETSIERLSRPPGLQPTLDAVVRVAQSTTVGQPDSFNVDEEARKFIERVLVGIGAWLEDAKRPLLDAQKEEPNNVLTQAIALIGAVEMRVDPGKVATVAKARLTEYRNLLQVASLLLGAVHTLAQVASATPPQALQVLPLISRGLADLLELVCGRVTAALPDLTTLPELQKRLLEPVKPPWPRDSIVELVAKPEAPVQLLPGKRSDAKFKVPRSWDMPGSSDSLVAALQKIAEGAEAVLKEDLSRSVSLDDALTWQTSVGALGYDALDAERGLHQAAIEMQRRVDAIVLPQDKLLAVSLQSIDAAFMQFGKFSADVIFALEPIDRDLRQVLVLGSQLAVDEMAMENLVIPVRSALRRSLDWLDTVIRKLHAQLSTWEVIDAASAAPMRALWTIYRDAIAQATRDLETRTTVKAWQDSPKGWLPALQDPADAATRSAALAIASLQQIVAQQFLTWQRSVTDLASPSLDALLDAIMMILRPVVAAYDTLAAVRTSVFRAASGTPAELVASVLLVNVDPNHVYPPALDALKVGTSASSTGNDQLFWDIASLKALGSRTAAASPPLPSIGITAGTKERVQAANFLGYFLRSWGSGNATPRRIVQQVQRISLEELRAKLLKLIDFAAIREEIEDQIKLLIPSSTTLSYEFETSIKDGAAAATGGIFNPRPGCALSVHSTTRVDLRNGHPDFSAVGELGAFDIKLVSKIDALTLHFNGVRFESRGGPSHCDLQYAGFTIGPALKFISDLQPYFGSKPGSGFYLRALETGIGVEAGYGLNLGTISIGTLSFFNVSLNAAARLPFDDRHATFVASLSRRDAPFTISIAPYGGSGYFALEADTKGIVGFEASFEYGGAAAFAYGPLTGQGRLMTGIYIRSSYAHTEISATFYVGGTASIWIFNFGASLYVNAHPTKDGRMVGDATYSFSFSMGIVDYDYHVSVHVSLGWGKNDDSEKKKSGGARKSAANRVRDSSVKSRVLLAAADMDVEDATMVSDAGSRAGWAPPARASFPSRPGSSVKADASKPTRHSDTWCQAQDWKKYSDYFVLDADVDVEEFTWQRHQR